MKRRGLARAARAGLALLVGVVSGGCATGGARVTDVRQLAGVWQGWLVGPNDARPAILAILGNGTFALESRLIQASGEITLAGGELRFEGGGAWHGTLVLKDASGRRTLNLERADRAFRGRFVEKPAS